jgi:hypothetical protein
MGVPPKPPGSLRSMVTEESLTLAKRALGLRLEGGAEGAINL